jgi:hypothetical protein
MSFNAAPKDTVIEYTLDKLDHALMFQINYQNPIVIDILSKGKFMASNGMTIEISNKPEAKISEWKIFLRGAYSDYDKLTDITTFTHNYKRDNAYSAVRLAMKEFGSFVRWRAQKSARFPSQSSYNSFGFARVTNTPRNRTCICW